MRPLVPHSPADARVVYELLLDTLHEGADGTASPLQQLALEGTVHLASLYGPTPPGPRIVVLRGPDEAALATMARAAAEAMGLPHVLVPLTSVSEEGWHGRSIAEWLAGLWSTPQWRAWSTRGVVILAGLEALRLRRGTYAGGSASTHDYREGKTENVASMLRGEPLPRGGAEKWDARHAMVVVTTGYDRTAHDADTLEDWGLLRTLARVLEAALWIYVPAADGARVSPGAILARLAPVITAHTVLGVELIISPEALQWAAAHATARGESAATAAQWISEPAHRRLAEMLADTGMTTRRVVLGPDDVRIPPRSRAVWRD